MELNKKDLDKVGGGASYNIEVEKGKAREGFSLNPYEIVTLMKQGYSIKKGESGTNEWDTGEQFYSIFDKNNNKISSKNGANILSKINQDKPVPAVPVKGDDLESVFGGFNYSKTIGADGDYDGMIFSNDEVIKLTNKGYEFVFGGYDGTNIEGVYKKGSTTELLNPIEVANILK